MLFRNMPSRVIIRRTVEEQISGFWSFPYIDKRERTVLKASIFNLQQNLCAQAALLKSLGGFWPAS